MTRPGGVESAPGEDDANSTPAATMKRILVIEDDDALREVLRSSLEDEGYLVAAAPDGITGLALAREFQPDVIVSDIRLPGIDGLGIARLVRGDPALRAVRLIAHSSCDLGVEAHAAGFDVLLTKGVRLGALVAAIEAAPPR
jgi:CheY-like chemotaxis protein